MSIETGQILIIRFWVGRRQCKLLCFRLTGYLERTETKRRISQWVNAAGWCTRTAYHMRSTVCVNTNTKVEMKSLARPLLAARPRQTHMMAGLLFSSPRTAYSHMKVLLLHNRSDVHCSCAPTAKWGQACTSESFECPHSSCGWRKSPQA